MISFVKVINLGRLSLKLLNFQIKNTLVLDLIAHRKSSLLGFS